jgi:glycosyltransferase involved in cell wall biosynthesis
MKKNKSKIIKINLGCGQDLKEGWINVDVLPELKPDIIHDLHQPLPFKNNFADYILAQDLLEHFTREDLQNLLAEITRVLKFGATLEIRVPNLEDIIDRFADDPETRNEFIYGTTNETGIFGAHKVGFTKPMLIAMMLNHNLKLETWKNVETNFVATFKKSKPKIKKNKLVYVNQTLGMGGAEVFMTDLLVELQNLGWEIIACTNNERFAKLLKQNKIKTENINTIVDIIGDWKGLIKGMILWPILIWEYWQILNKHKNANLFLFSSYIEKILFSPLAKLANKPIVWIEFGPMNPIFKKFFQLPKILYFLVKSIPEKVIVPSTNTKNHLTSNARISLAKLKVIACGRNLNIKNTPSQKNLIVCVSRLEKGKGQDLLVQAFAKVVQKIPQAKLQIIGEGDFQQIIEKEISKYNLSKNVSLEGRVQNSLQTLSHAEVVVFPSVWPLEGFGLVMIEAMSLGKPIVAFNISPVPEIIKDEDNGLLAKSHDVEDLAQKIILLLKSEKLKNKLGKQAQADFQTNYLIKNIAKKYQQVFLEAMNFHHSKNQNF